MQHSHAYASAHRLAHIQPYRTAYPNSQPAYIRSAHGSGRAFAALCLDAGTTYPNTACGFGINTGKPFCDPALPTEQRARDLVRASAPSPSRNRSILTEICLCHACSDHEIEDGNGAAGAAHDAL